MKIACGRRDSLFMLAPKKTGTYIHFKHEDSTFTSSYVFFGCSVLYNLGQLTNLYNEVWTNFSYPINSTSHLGLCKLNIEKQIVILSL